MIDKINRNDVYYQGQNRKKNPAVRAYENTPGTKEAAQKKAAGAQKSSQTKAADSRETGVILDLSKKTSAKKGHAAAKKRETSWTDAVRKLLAPVLQWIKAFWESDSSTKADEPETPGVQAVEAEISEAQGIEEDPKPEEAGLPPLDALEETADLEAAAQEAVRSGSIEKIEQFVTQNGRKRLAHNSGLLTYYDRRGKIVEMDETAKHRVLFGDKNVLKL